MITISTQRLKLRPVTLADAGALEPLFNSWGVIQWLSSPPWPYTPADMTGYIESLLASTAPDREIVRVIELDGRPIGAIGHRHRPASHLQTGDGPNIGYWLGQSAWGRGYMTEAAAGLVEHLFAEPATGTVHSGAFAGNPASLRLQTKLGFVVTGTTTLMSRPHKTMLPHVNTMLTRDVWAARMAATATSWS